MTQNGSCEPTVQPLVDVHDKSADQVRKRVLANLDSITQVALRKTRSYMRRDGSVIETPDPDLRSALGAQELGAKLMGAIIDRSEVRTRYEQRPLQELLADAAEHLARLHADALAPASALQAVNDSTPAQLPGKRTL